MDLLLFLTIRRFIGTFIRDARIRLNLTRSEAGEFLNINTEDLIAYESGKQPIPCNVLALLIQKYRIDLEEFYKKLNSVVCGQS